MIPLNRPGKIIFDKKNNKSCILEEKFHRYDFDFLYASRDGLNYIYKEIYEKYGSITVAVSPLTCFEALYPIVLNRHKPKFIDIDPDTLNIDTKILCREQDVNAVQMIYLGGNPSDINSVVDWATKNGKIIIEDCAQAFGSTYNGQALGSFGDYSVFSMVKNFYAEYGGLVLSKNKMAITPTIVSQVTIAYKYIKRELEKKVDSSPKNIYNLIYSKLLRAREAEKKSATSDIRGIRSECKERLLRYLGTIDSTLVAKKKIAQRIISRIDLMKYDTQTQIPGGDSNYNRILIISKNKKAKELIAELRNRGIAANNLTQNYLYGFQEHIKRDAILGKYYSCNLPNYETIFPFILSIPVSPFLTDYEIDYITTETNKIN